MRGLGPWTTALAACFASPSRNGETLASLSARVEEALADSTSIQLLNSRLADLSLNRTYVGPSPTAGRGLFAGVDCPEGTLLTCYPGDGILDVEDEEVFWGYHVAYADDGTAWDPDYLMYASDEIGLIGLPQLDQDPAYLGHFANDGVSELPRTLEDTFTTYCEESLSRANAREQDILNGCHMVLMATRDIAKDEEIFLCYGPEYWMHQLGLTDFISR